MKTLLVYKSKTGFTERYAHWIAEEIHCDVFPYAKRGSIHWKDYDTVMFGGGFYAGKLAGLSWLKKQAPSLAGKHVIVFATGATPSGTEAAKTALAQNLAGFQGELPRAFYFQSGLNYEKMSALDKAMMRVFRAMLKRTEGESQAYDMVRASFDQSSREQIRPLLRYVEEIEA